MKEHGRERAVDAPPATVDDAAKGPDLAVEVKLEVSVQEIGKHVAAHMCIIDPTLK